MDRRRFRNVALIVVFGVALGIGSGVTYAAFSWTTANGATTLATAPDWTGPTGTTVIAEAGSTTSGTINPISAYYVYANVTDTGNPASGIATVTANVTNITTGQSAAALTTTGGPFTIDGVSYAYRSASLTADAGLAAGSKTFTVAMTDNAGNAGSANGSVNVVILTAPSAVDIQSTNGGTAHKADSGDTIIFTYSRAMSPGSILSGWTGASQAVQVKFTQNGCVNGNDRLDVQTTTGGAINLGYVCLGANFANGSRTLTATMTMSGSIVTVGITSSSTGFNVVASSNTMVWNPSASATDTFGNACSTTAATESGAADIDF
ncbi:MAG: hypothetical protein ACXVQ0_08605 [Actinomycetota bacterium]